MKTLPPDTGPSRLYRLWITLDEFANVALLNGLPFQTVSQHAALSAAQGAKWACIFCRLVAYVIPHHCANQFIKEDE